MPGFQTSVGVQPAPGIEGGFYGANPHFTLTNPGEGQLIAGTPAPYVGRFGFMDAATGQVTASHPGTAIVRVGFVHRDQGVMISPVFGQSSMQVVAGREVDLMEDGPVWGRFAAGAVPTQKVYASYADGSLRAAATGQPATSAGITATTTNGSPNLTNVAGGTLAPGQPVSGAGIPAGAYIVSASGATAVMSTSATAGAAGVAITASLDVETNFAVRSYASNGELAKISVRG
jgi:hypothetical protein